MLQATTSYTSTKFEKFSSNLINTVKVFFKSFQLHVIINSLLDDLLKVIAEVSVESVLVNGSVDYLVGSSHIPNP